MIQEQNQLTLSPSCAKIMNEKDNTLGAFDLPRGGAERLLQSTDPPDRSDDECISRKDKENSDIYNANQQTSNFHRCVNHDTPFLY